MSLGEWIVLIGVGVLVVAAMALVIAALLLRGKLNRAAGALREKRKRDY